MPAVHEPRAIVDARPPAHEVTSERDDRTRLRAMVDAHHARLWRIVRRLGIGPGDVDDVVQQVFLTASRRMRDIERGRERAFLTAVAVRLAANARRDRTRRREVSLDETSDTHASTVPPDALVMAKSAREQLEIVLGSLTQEQRAVFVLFEFEEMSTAEISEELSIPMGTVASRLRRAREIVEDKIARLRARDDSRERSAQ